MEKQTIEVNDQFFEVPEYVTPDKLEDFITYCKIRLEWDNMDKLFELEKGVIVHFPRVLKKHKKILETKDKETQDSFNEKRKLVQDQLLRLMHAKRKISIRTSKDVREELEDRTSEILELFGQDYSVAEVHKLFKDKNINIPYPSLLKFAKRNNEKIKELRNTWRENLDDVSLSIKRSRLEKLNYLLNDLLTHYDEATPLNKLSYSKEIRGIIEQARKEVEGEEIKFTISGRIDIDATISSYLNESHILKDLTIHQLVISRIAARMGLPSMSIIEKLATSFYSKFNGFRINNDLSTKIIYPSSVKYDILDLEQKNKQIEDKVIEPVLIELESSDRKKIDTGRQRLNKKIDELLDRNKKVKQESHGKN